MTRSPEAVLAEINGCHVTGPDAGKPLSAFNEMRADGSTACGCWIYSGVYRRRGQQVGATHARAAAQSPSQSEWGWVWPADRRILYNRASADPDGKPWSERKRYVWWDEESGSAGSATTSRTSRSTVRRAPDRIPTSVGPPRIAGDDPFIMQADGKGWLFAPNGLVDGPLPTHYEPQESPVANALYPQQQNPAASDLPAQGQPRAPPSAATPGRRGVPVRVHHLPADRAPHRGRDEPLAARISRNCSRRCSARSPRSWPPNAVWSTTAGPPSSRRGRRSRRGCWSPSGCVRCASAATTVHQIGLPYHWGVGGDAVVTGDAANDLLGVTLDPNVHIQESKVGLLRHPPGRRPRGPRWCEDLTSRLPPSSRITESGHGRGCATVVRTAERSRIDAGIHRARRMTLDRRDPPERWHGSDRSHRPDGATRGWTPSTARKGFFTDTSICIGCKACEVACKEWNGNPAATATSSCSESSYDNTGQLGAQHLAPRRVHRAEPRAASTQARESGRALVGLGMPARSMPRKTARRPPDAAPRWTPHRRTRRSSAG